MSEDEIKIKKPYEIVNIVDNILEFNEQKQKKIEGKGLKILTPSQMLSRLSISLAQLKAGNNSKKLKRKLGNYYILCTDQKNLQQTLTKVLSTLFKTCKQFYEH